MSNLVGLSLFANIGVAEAYFNDIGVNIAIANEIDSRRAAFYKHIYPDVKVIVGDITKEDVFSSIIDNSRAAGVNFIIATPPCQGMSTVGKMDPHDPRNQLVTYAIKAIQKIKPKFVLFENIPQHLRTKINYCGKTILIPEYVKLELEDEYNINDSSLINAADYGVPQNRVRSIFLMIRKDLATIWGFPKKERKIVTLRDAIGSLPSIDPIVQSVNRGELLKVFPDFERKEQEGYRVSKWHKPPKHKMRHIQAMMYTPEGSSALLNEKHYPKKADGTRIIGFSNTYKRQWWDKPAYTVTTYNGAICSHDNVHPGRPIGFDENGCMRYSDTRVLTIYELLIVMSLPNDWNIPDWADESLIRHSIGEGIPPLLVKKIMNNIIRN